MSPELALLSNAFVYSAIVVYTLALITFAMALGVDAGRCVLPGGTVAVDSRLTLESAVTRRPSSAPVLTVDQVGSRAPGTDRQMFPEGRGLPEGTSVATSASRRVSNVAVALTWLAFLLHFAAVLTRGLTVARVPWGNMYEFSISGALVVSGVFLATLLRRDIRYLGLFVVGPVLLTLGLAITVLYAQASQLVPALHSFWLIVHVSVAFVASALFTLGFSTTVLQLVQHRREQLTQAGRPPTRGRFMSAVPDSTELERSAFRMHAVAFPLWTFALMAGAIWAEAAWGRYWNWDPKEIWTFIIWVVYACYLHARSTRGWDGRRAAYLALAGYGCLLVNFLVVNMFLVGLHSYAGVR